MMSREELLEKVCLQLIADLENWEVEAIHELLDCVPEKTLRGYLSEVEE
jgi:hypothetical protein